MKLNAIQTNLNNFRQPSFREQKGRSPYLNAEGAISTVNNVKPLPPQGHLIHDNFGNKIKYFFKDIAYDLKSIKNGFNGSANDHQLGRINDIGITTAGILIATYLASRTKNPKARVMEYVGLGTFLAVMSIYPKIAINGPAKLVHGFDIDKEYIDDQGRKKSVMQDANYVPYDMYLGEIPEEDLSVIGDKMGIPKDIKNRNDVIKEQMRKISTQNNTLWMLTAGVTPALTALVCCGLENYAVGPLLEKIRTARSDNQLSNVLKETASMKLDIKDIKENSLSRSVKNLLKNYSSQELPKEEYDNLIKILTQGLFENTNVGIEEDVARILKNSAGKNCESLLVNSEIIEKLLINAENTIPGHKKEVKEAISKALVPSKEELETVLKPFISSNGDITKGATIKASDTTEIRVKLEELMSSKLGSANGIPEKFLNAQKNKIVDEILETLKTNKSLYVSEESIEQITNLAKILGEFKENQKVLQNFREFSLEHTDESIIARSYNKFEKTLLDVLGIKNSELKKMEESSQYAQEILEKRFAEVAKDNAKYENAIKKLSNVITEMELKLHGNKEDKSRLLDLITAIENNYNNTAKRLSALGNFESTVQRLVMEDVGSLSKTLNSKQELFDFLDGLMENVYKDIVSFNGGWDKLSQAEKEAYVNYCSKGVGSSKRLEINRILERYQGAKNSFYRIIHTFDVYKRAENIEGFKELLPGKSNENVLAILEKAKKTLLSATSADHTLKLNLENNPEFYKDLLNSIWAGESGEFYSTKQKGLVSDTTRGILEKNNSMKNGKLLERFQYYITRFRNIVGGNKIDFTKPGHITNPYIHKQYQMDAKTTTSMFNLIAQTPVDMAKGAAKRKYATQQWAKTIGAIVGGVCSVAILAQFTFGKLNNPQNLTKKQVNDDSNK